MTDAATAAASVASAASDKGAEPWTARIAWQLLDEPARVDLAVLFRFIAAVRAVADHPALALERKEAALAALAAPFGAADLENGGSAAAARHAERRAAHDAADSMKDGSAAAPFGAATPKEGGGADAARHAERRAAHDAADSMKGGPAAAPFGAEVTPAPANGAWMAPARALAGLLAARGLDARPAWQILQAAGQDLRKTRYRDWSDLLTWCRFAAAPVGDLVARLLGAEAATAQRAEALAIAVQIGDIVSRAPSHYRWLGRVYLPERWFTEARGDAADLGFQRRSPALKAVLGRALDQAAALMDDAKDIGAGLKGWRRRAAASALMLEMRADIRALARAGTQVAPRPPGAVARRVIQIRALARALLVRS